MTATAIAHRRLAEQRLSQNPGATPEEIVGSLGAVQAQDYLGAKWALGLRLRNPNDETIERAFNAGSILRTHVMRPTWHFVLPSDIRWLLELTAPRVNAVNAYTYRQVALDDALFSRSQAIIAKALEGGRQLTRAELGLALAEGGIAAEGLRMICILQHAELDAVICSGPRRGKQFTYALLTERAPHARSLLRDEALAELTRRYFSGHGPATIQDFAWWSGLTVADAKAGIAIVASHLSNETIDGKLYWYSAAARPSPEPSPSAFLLPTYDEFLVGYSSFGASRQGGLDGERNLVFDSTIVIGGRIVGTWRRTFQKGTVVIELAPFAPLTTAERAAIDMAAQRYGDFVGMPVELVE